MFTQTNAEGSCSVLMQSPMATTYLISHLTKTHGPEQSCNRRVAVTNIVKQTEIMGFHLK